MFTTYEMTRAFVAERQGSLRHEARSRQVDRGHRRRRRQASPVEDRAAA
jgi:hypothetical protein